MCVWLNIMLISITPKIHREFSRLVYFFLVRCGFVVFILALIAAKRISVVRFSRCGVAVFQLFVIVGLVWQNGFMDFDDLINRMEVSVFECYSPLLLFIFRRKQKFMFTLTNVVRLNHWEIKQIFTLNGNQISASL